MLSRDTETVEALDAVLARLERVWSGGGARSPVKGVSQVRKAIAPHLTQTIDDMLDDLRAEAAAKAARAAAKAVRDDVVASYVKRLEEAAHDRQVFDSVFADLSTDRRVRKVELDAIAERYAGGPAKRRNKAAGFEAIRASFFERALRERNAQVAEKATPW